MREVLRARPAILDTPRLLTEDFEIGGYTIPKGWMVAPSIPHVQGSDDDFDPGRENGDEGWIPFGGGKRHCVGSHLALLELETVIAEVVRAVDLAPPPDASPERALMVHVTLAPARRGTVVATPARVPARAPAVATTAGSPTVKPSTVATATVAFTSW